MLSLVFANTIVLSFRCKETAWKPAVNEEINEIFYFVHEVKHSPTHPLLLLTRLTSRFSHSFLKKHSYHYVQKPKHWHILMLKNTPQSEQRLQSISYFHFLFFLFTFPKVLVTDTLTGYGAECRAHLHLIISWLYVYQYRQKRADTKDKSHTTCRSVRFREGNYFVLNKNTTF